MNVEILAVGTELLLGQTVNTNAAEIALRLADRGFTHRYQGVVGDNHERMADAIRAAVSRADALIITGGIGPTRDDITREVVADVAGVELVFDDDFAARLRARWERSGREFPESNLRQAFRPGPSTVIENRKGSAPGFRIEIDGCWVVALPGVPQEMLEMLDADVIPFLAEQAGEGGGVVVSRLIRSWGMSESMVGERLDDLFDELTNPTVAFLASSGVIKVRLTALAPTRDEAEALIGPVEEEVCRRLGPAVFGFDDDTIEVILHRILRERGWTIGTAESATAGMVAARLTSIPGSSDAFRGSIVGYAPDVKMSVLGVPREVLDEHGAVSEETAVAMAAGARRVLDVDVAVAVTGSAGPDPLERDVGTMCIAVVTPEAEWVRTMHLPGDRERVRTYATTAALHSTRIALDRP